MKLRKYVRSANIVVSCNYTYLSLKNDKYNDIWRSHRRELNFSTLKTNNLNVIMAKYKIIDLQNTFRSDSGWFGILPVSLMCKFGLTVKRISSNR